MKPTILGFCCLLLLACIVVVKSNPLPQDDDLSPLNEVYIFQNEDDDRNERDKRKIGIVKLGVSNGLINFVFGKLDAFLDATTKSLSVLDEGNKLKNAAFEIDNTKSATSEFINKFIAQKIKASSSSVGPLLNAGTTFLSSAKQGLAGAFASKFAPLSSLSGGLVGGLTGASGGSGGSQGYDDGSSSSGGSNSGTFLTGLLGSLSSSSGGGNGIAGLSSGLSGSSGGNGISAGDDLGADYPTISAEANAGGSAGFANLGNSGVNGKY